MAVSINYNLERTFRFAYDLLANVAEIRGDIVHISFSRQIQTSGEFLFKERHTRWIQLFLIQQKGVDEIEKMLADETNLYGPFRLKYLMEVCQKQYLQVFPHDEERFIHTCAKIAYIAVCFQRKWTNCLAQNEAMDLIDSWIQSLPDIFHLLEK